MVYTNGEINERVSFPIDKALSDKSNIDNIIVTLSQPGI